MNERYFVRGVWTGARWDEVGEEEFRKLERWAGFNGETAGWSTYLAQGRVTYNGAEPDPSPPLA